jgi:hypothetical protein
MTWQEVVYNLGCGALVVVLILGLAFAAVSYSRGRP